MDARSDRAICLRESPARFGGHYSPQSAHAIMRNIVTYAYTPDKDPEVK
ncbi:MAG: hypothetical protein NTV86_03770 [Planctomycetota bacterium]|nr:hypothetical protein [Planctomycetota bacterium]